MRFTIFLFLGIGCVLFTWFIIGSILFTEPEEVLLGPPVPEPPSSTGTPRQTITPISIPTWEGEEFSAQALIDSNTTEQITSEGLYRNTTADDFYSIYYYEPTGHLSIQLYAESLGVARELAEQQLKSVFSQYSDAQLCELQIEVITHREVSREYANKNLGLSFCPFAIPLPN